VGQTLALLRRELDGKTPVIGFCGAPFTLAAYLVEGEGREGFGAVKSLLFRDSETLEHLLAKLADAMGEYLLFQIRSGAQAVQIFDSWAGILSPADYRRVALPPVKHMIRAIGAAGVPVIYFAPAAGHLLEDMATSGADVLGVCWRTPLDQARHRVGNGIGVQGNLDPHALFAAPEVVRERALAVLDQAGEAPGHIMNLGHGILPDTPIASAYALVEAVQSRERRLV
jgi:uroporphyrinogen decarboxylase